MNKKKDREDDSPAEEVDQAVVVKFEKPKILLVELNKEVCSTIKSAGYNVASGTFGSPYKVQLDDMYDPVISAAKLPNFTEQEIIIIDLTPPKTLEKPLGKKKLSAGENDWWAKRSTGKIDPRPRAMKMAQKAFDRIFDHGGLFVIFAQPRLEQDFVWGAIGLYDALKKESRIEVDNWSFLSVLDRKYFGVEPNNGYEILVPDKEDEIFRFLKKLRDPTEYFAAFTHNFYGYTYNWTPILFDKFNQCIGGTVTDENGKGMIVVLPQIAKEPDRILTLIQEVLPDLSPHLFPHIEGVRWIEREVYELPTVLEYKNEIVKVKKAAENKLIELEKEILEERKKYGFLHGLIAYTGQDLVRNVKTYLEQIGFNKVVDVDEEINDQDSSAKQEDLQIHDQSPTLVFESKGPCRATTRR